MQEVTHLQEQLDLANSRMQSVNHALQQKTNESLEMHAQFILAQKRNSDLAQVLKDKQAVIEELQKQVVDFTAAAAGKSCISDDAQTDAA